MFDVKCDVKLQPVIGHLNNGVLIYVEPPSWSAMVIMSTPKSSNISANGL